MMSKVKNKLEIYRIPSWVAMILFLVICGLGCFKSNVDVTDRNVHLIVDWNKLILNAEIHSEGYRGPVAARVYAYVGLAAYEAALPGLYNEFQSLASRFPGLRLPPSPLHDQFDIGIALNACYATMLNHFFIASPEYVSREREELRGKWDSMLLPGRDTSIVRISKRFGFEVANAVYAWSATDSLGYRAHHHNYDREYVPPVGDGKWVASMDFPMPPLLPYWRQVRPMIIETSVYLAKPLPPYSTLPNQIYYVQAAEIISLSKPLTLENQWIAEFWNDDRPGLTFTPAGRWLAVTNQVIVEQDPSVEKTLETYLRIGFALCDAMIACWYSKYEYCMERPETYIQKHIDKTWRPFSPSPSFPSYPSGHAMIGAAAAEVLTSLYGSTFAMTDKSHDGLKDISIKPRNFQSFDQMAKENALSRILLGVHWRMDCEEGLRLGSLIGKEVNQLVLENTLTE